MTLVANHTKLNDDMKTIIIIVKFLFCEANGEVSWRKIMTAGATIVFMTASIGYLIANKFAELPDSYQLIISGVFGFYFLKSILRNVTTK